jgi:serine/threonine protein kinase
MRGLETRRCGGDDAGVSRAATNQEDFDAADDEASGRVSMTAPPRPRLEIGRLIEGRLRVVRLLGRGGMSEVYEVYDERAKRTEAVKLLLTDRCTEAQFAIFAEARALVRFRHPHVIGFYGVGAIEQQPFIELERLSGGSLADRIEIHGAMLPVTDVLDILAKVADALAALHDAGIVHRDIKADNVLLADEGRPVLGDFGLAMAADDLPALPQGIIGTPAYMAPEAILGITESFEQYAAADQYSLGVTAYYALTGTLPFDAPTASALFYAQMAVEPPPPSSRRSDLPPELDALVLRALAKRPNERFPSVAAMRDAIMAIRAQLPATPATPSAATVPEPAGDGPTTEGPTTPTPALKPTMVAA